MRFNVERLTGLFIQASATLGGRRGKTLVVEDLTIIIILLHECFTRTKENLSPTFIWTRC
jgi:hypothetical protein